MSIVSYQIIRSGRKTLSLQITPTGEVIVRCPNRMPKRQIDGFLAEKQDWIARHLAKIEARPQLPPFTGEQLEVLADRAKDTIALRVKQFAPLVGVSYGRITIRSQHTRWGSCSAKGNLNFNCLLMLTPPEVLDYVVIHELCHRKELNHSPKFWAEVEKVCPEYKTHRKWLKDNGGALIARLPQK